MVRENGLSRQASRITSRSFFAGSIARSGCGRAKPPGPRSRYRAQLASTRQQIVGAVDLDAVTGIINHRDIGIARRRRNAHTIQPPPGRDGNRRHVENRPPCRRRRDPGVIVGWPAAQRCDRRNCRSSPLSAKCGPLHQKELRRGCLRGSLTIQTSSSSSPEPCTFYHTGLSNKTKDRLCEVRHDPRAGRELCLSRCLPWSCLPWSTFPCICLSQAEPRRKVRLLSRTGFRRGLRDYGGVFVGTPRHGHSSAANSGWGVGGFMA